jgi:1-phosphatidylinositol-4-phosphate 5-kinase
MKILPGYLDHLIRYPSTLLPKFLGAYTIKMYKIEIHFVVTLNLFPKGSNISERYDLKGSWIDRNNLVENSDKRIEITAGKSPLYKDNDLKEPLNLEPNVAEEIVEILINDTNFLKGSRHYILILILNFNIYNKF